MLSERFEALFVEIAACRQSALKMHVFRALLMCGAHDGCAGLDQLGTASLPGCTAAKRHNTSTHFVYGED